MFTIFFFQILLSFS